MIINKSYSDFILVIIQKNLAIFYEENINNYFLSAFYNIPIDIEYKSIIIKNSEDKNIIGLDTYQENNNQIDFETNYKNSSIEL
jgi:hypothetical protein